MLTNLRLSAGNFALRIDAGDSTFVSREPADMNGSVNVDVPPGTYAVSQGPTQQGPWTPVAHKSAHVVAAELHDAAGDLAPVHAVFPGSGSGRQKAVGLLAGAGVPSNGDGKDGWFYFRSDGGPGASVYQRRAGVWAGIL